MASSSKWTRARQWAGRPVAVPLRDAAELLHVDLEAIQAAAAALQPFVAADGTPNWSLRAPAAKLTVASNGRSRTDDAAEPPGPARTPRASTGRSASAPSPAR
jgi:hypothetical protein